MVSISVIDFVYLVYFALFFNHSTISFAMSSGDLSFTIEFRALFWQGNARKLKPSPANLTGFAFCNAGITVRMLTMRLRIIFRLGNCRSPSQQRRRAITL